MPRLTKSEWTVVGGLLFLSLVPFVGGLVRLVDSGDSSLLCDVV